MPPSGGRNETPTNAFSYIYPHVKTWEFLRKNGLQETKKKKKTHLAKTKTWYFFRIAMMTQIKKTNRKKKNGRSWFFLMAPSVVDRKETKDRHGIKLREKMHHVACKNIFHSIQYEKGMGKFVLNLWRKVTMRKISWEGINHNYCLCSYRYLEPSSKKTTKNDDHNKNVVIFNFYVIAFKLGGEIFLALVSVWSSTP